MSKKEMNPSAQFAFDMAKIFLDIETKSFKSGMKYAKEDAEREQKMQAFVDKCERDVGIKPLSKEHLQEKLEILFDSEDFWITECATKGTPFMVYFKEKTNE
tara:strand:- start:436 stop:741 length:306 start_codon:yes stop_codon:yes gene_type:complete